MIHLGRVHSLKPNPNATKVPLPRSTPSHVAYTKIKLDLMSTNDPKRYLQYLVTNIAHKRILFGARDLPLLHLLLEYIYPIHFTTTGFGMFWLPSQLTTFVCF